MATFSVEPNDRVKFIIRFEDDDLMVVEKAAGVPTQPGRGHRHDTLLNAAFARAGQRLQNLGKARDFGLLHRLDKPTSGLVVIATSARAYDGLREKFASREVRKFYWAVVKGEPRADRGVINKPILESGGGDDDDAGPRRAKTARINPAGKPAVTAYRVVQTGIGASLLECRPLTGRLHQVRIHLAAVHCPILGDDVYARDAVRAASPRLALHAHRLAFDHPVTGAAIDIRTAWPRDLRGLLKRFGLRTPGAMDASVTSKDAAAGEAGTKPASDSGAVEGLHELQGDGVGDEDPGVGEHPA